MSPAPSLHVHLAVVTVVLSTVSLRVETEGLRYKMRQTVVTTLTLEYKVQQRCRA